MTCPFDLAHYREVLDSAKSGGYRFAGFDRPPEPGDLILRHDVDLSLDAALALAEVEAEAGAPMSGSVSADSDSCGSEPALRPKTRL